MRLLPMLAVLLSGSYWCTAQDGASLPPSIPPVAREHLVRFFGTSIQQPVGITCAATGIPAPRVRWFHNDEEVPQDSEYFLLSGADNDYKLTFRTENMDEYDIKQQGVLYCEAVNEHGKARSDRVTMVQIRPKIGEVERDRQFKLFGEGVLPTAKKGGAYKYTTKVVWKRGHKDAIDSQAQELDQDSEEYFVDLEGNLRIMSVQENDFDKRFLFTALTPRYGFQTATVKYIVNRDGSRPADHKVALKRVYPIDKDNKKDVVALIGERMELQCVYFARAADNTITSKISWSHPLQAVVDINQEISFNRRLIVKKVDKSSQGLYVCEGSDGAGNTQKFTFNVTVQSYPEWSGESLKSLIVVEGDTATFTCSANGEPKPKAVWSINEEPGVSNGEIQGVQKGNSLEFTGVTTNDQFSVSCNASNDHGYVYGNAFLKVISASVFSREPQMETVVQKLGSQFTLTCMVKNDPLLTVTWMWYKNNRLFNFSSGVIYKKGPSECSGSACNSTLVIKTDEYTRPENIDANYKCVAEIRTNLDTAFKDDQSGAWDVKVEGIPKDLPVQEAGIPFWVWIIIAVALIIIIVLVIICCCCMRKKGQDYPLDALERKAGHDPAQELLDTGYHDYERPPPYEDAPANHIELDEDDKPLDSDTDSMAEYGDIDTGKFNEDGSFIGQYGSDRKKKSKVDDTNV